MCAGGGVRSYHPANRDNSQRGAMVTWSLYWLVAVAAAAGTEVSTINEVDNVWQNWQNRRDNEIRSLWPLDADSVQPRQVIQVIWNSCGQPADPIHLKTLKIPEVINLESSVNITVDLAITSTLKSPIKVKLKAQRKVLFFWVTVPCIEEQFGSCMFSDLCMVKPFGNSSSCPPVFVENHIPCVCPFLPAEYQLDEVPIDLSKIKIPEALVSGKYYVKAEFEDGHGQRLGCYETVFVLS